MQCHLMYHKLQLDKPVGWHQSARKWGLHWSELHYVASKTIIIEWALHGLKTVGDTFRSHLVNSMHHMENEPYYGGPCFVAKVND